VLTNVLSDWTDNTGANSGGPGESWSSESTREIVVEGVFLRMYRAIGIAFSWPTADASMNPTSLPHLVSMMSNNANSCALCTHPFGNQEALCMT
jgi:hypothetical protein